MPHDALRNHHSFTVDRDRYETASCRREHPSRQSVTRLFDEYLAARVKENAGGDIQRLLRAGNHHNLVGLAFDRTRGAEVLAYCLAKPL